MQNKKKYIYGFLYITAGFMFFCLLLAISFFIDSIPFGGRDCIWELSKNKILVYEMKKNYESKDDNFLKDFKTNSSGFRDYEFGQEKDENIKKILVFGDSIAVGTDSIIYSNDLFSKQLENIIEQDKSLKYRYDVYNMGVDGYNTVQEAENLNLHVNEYKPDIVVVTYCLNDVDDCSRGIYYQILATSQFGPVGHYLLKSKIYNAFCQVLFDTMNLHEKIKIGKKCDKYWGFEESGMNIPEKGFRMFDFLQKKYNFKLYVFIVPFLVDYNNYEYEKQHESVQSVLNKYNIKGFDMIKCFSDISKDGSFFDSGLKDKMHPNEFGHRLMAEFIYKKLKTENALN